MATATRPPATPPAQGRPGEKTARATTTRGRDVVDTFVIDKDAQGNFVERKLSDSTPKERAQSQAAYDEYARNKAAEYMRSEAYLRLQMRYKDISTPTLTCNPTTIGTAKQRKENWLCGLDRYIRFDEQTWSVQENEFRLFIEGAEVTNYLEGSLSWTVESTGGMNTCRFVLNNTQDAFIINPINVCAGPDKPEGWRLAGANGSMGRTNWRVDETAKRQIYQQKFKEVGADQQGMAQIDGQTGMWLYPLNPFSCIFNKHDVVRGFVKLPHRGGRIPYLNADKTVDMWMPVFTGFIKDYSWTDNPVDGHRTINITAYDYRGLMEKMRVRIFAGRTSNGTNHMATTTGGSKTGSAKQERLDAARLEVDVTKMPWLTCSVEAGKSAEVNLKNVAVNYKKLWPEANFNPINPYIYARELLFFNSTFDDLHALELYHGLRIDERRPTAGHACGPMQGDVRGKINIRRGHLAKANVDFDPVCAARALDSANAYVSGLACKFIEELTRILYNLAVGYELTGKAQRLYYDVTKATAMSKQSGKRLVSVTVKEITKKDSDSVVRIMEDLQKAYASKKQALVDTAVKLYVIDALLKGVAPQEHRLGGLWAAMGPKVEIRELVDPTLVKLRRSLEGAKNSTFASLLALESSIRAPIFTRNILLRDQQNQTNTQIDANRVTQVQAQIQELEKNSAALKEQVFGDKKEADEEKRKELRGQLEENERLLRGLRNTLKNIQSAVNRIRRTASPISGTDVGMADINAAIDDFNKKAFAKFVESSLLAHTGTMTPPSVDLDNVEAVVKAAMESANARIATERKAYSSYLDKVITSAIEVIKKVAIGIGEALLRGVTPRTARIAAILNDLNKKIDDHLKAIPRDGLGKDRDALPRFMGNIRGLQQRLGDLRADGEDKATRAQTLGETFVKHANFETKHAGIFADLVSTIKDQPHPLANKSFEHSVEVLCCDQQKILPGVKQQIHDYSANKRELDKWNRMVLFGVVGRPLTYAEVSHIGKNSVSDMGNTYSPYNVFYHMLVPKNGTGAATIIQMNTGQAGIDSLTLNYSTRKALLDEICSILDYQFFVSGWGDLIFELPNYNAFPQDFGDVFKGTYTIAKEWTQVSISEESKDIPTAWVLKGLASEARLGNAADASVAVSNELTVTVLMAPILARRLGVKVENVNIKIPGLGTGTEEGDTTQKALRQLEIYGMFHIQKTLGAAHMLQIGMMFRPYIVPNRPIYFVPRQRIGLVQAVTHTLNFPNGACKTDCTMGQIRFLFRDGTFRYMAGGKHLPIDYVSFFTGIPPLEKGREGSGKGTDRSTSSVGCSAELAQRAREANAFSTAVAHQWGMGFKANFKVVRPSAPRTEAVVIEGSGLRVTSGAETRPQKAASAPNGAQKTTGDPLAAVSHSPWQYSAPKPPPGTAHGWGYFRNFREHAGGYRHTAEQFFLSNTRQNIKDYVHDGWDLGLMVGRAVLAPVDIYHAETRLNVGAWAGVSRYAYILASEKGAAQFKVDPKEAATSAEGKQWIKIHGEQYLLWKRLGGNKSGIKVVRRHTGGLILDATGYVNLPKVNAEGRVKATLGYVHLHTLRTIKDGNDTKTIGGTLKGNKNGTTPIVKAGEVIAYGGASGTVNSHLHFVLWLHPNDSIQGSNQSDADKAQAAAALAANKEFVDAQLRALAEFYEMDRGGNDPRDKFLAVNKPAATYWQRHAAKFGKKSGEVVTIEDVVKAFQKKMRYKEFVPSDSSKAKVVKVNPTFFFAREQLIGGVAMNNMDRYGPPGDVATRALADELYARTNPLMAARTSACVAVSGKLDEVLARHKIKCNELHASITAMAGLPKDHVIRSIQNDHKRCLSELDAFNKWKPTCAKVATNTRYATQCTYHSAVAARAVEEELRKSTQANMGRDGNRLRGHVILRTNSAT